MASVVETAVYRDFSVARIFELALATVRDNPVVTAGLAFLFGTIPGLLASYAWSRVTDEAADDGDAVIWGLFIFYFFISSAISALTQAFQTRATTAQAEGRQASFFECVGAGAAVLLPVAGLAVLVSAAITVGHVLLLIPGFFLGALWWAAVPALVEERRGIVPSLRRSQELTRGVLWKVFGLVLLMFAVSMLVLVAVEIMSGQWNNESLTAAYSSPMYLLLSIVTGTAMNLFWGAVQASLYVELRDWKDGPATAQLEQIFR